MNLEHILESKELLAAIATVVGAAAGGLGLLMLALKIWGLFRKEFSNADLEKQQAALQSHTTNRMLELEKQLAERQEKINSLTSDLGELRGECKALKMQNTELERAKEYWSARTREAETKFSGLEDAVDSLTVHAIQAEMKIAVLSGELDAKTVNINPVEVLPRVIREKLAKAREGVIAAGALEAAG